MGTSKSFSLSEEMKRYARYREKIKELRIMDDIFMKMLFQDMACVKCVLDVILDKDLNIIHAEPETDIHNLGGKSVRFDVYAIDGAGKQYNIEIQRNLEGSIPKRARRNSSFMDAHATDSGQYGENLGETYVIFIVEHDVLGQGLPIYHIERTIMETGQPFGDEEHIIYVNAGIQDDTKLGKLMQDLYAADGHAMHYSDLQRRTIQLKENEKEVKQMCQIMDDIHKEGLDEGRAEGRAVGRVEGRAEGRAEAMEEAICMIADAIPHDELAQRFGLSIEQLNGILDKNGVTPYKG